MPTSDVRSQVHDDVEANIITVGQSGGNYNSQNSQNGNYTNQNYNQYGNQKYPYNAPEGSMNQTQEGMNYSNMPSMNSGTISANTMHSSGTTMSSGNAMSTSMINSNAMSNGYGNMNMATSNTTHTTAHIPGNNTGGTRARYYTNRSDDFYTNSSSNIVCNNLYGSDNTSSTFNAAANNINTNNRFGSYQSQQQQNSQHQSYNMRQCGTSQQQQGPQETYDDHNRFGASNTTLQNVNAVSSDLSKLPLSSDLQNINISASGTPPSVSAASGANSVNHAGSNNATSGLNTNGMHVNSNGQSNGMNANATSGMNGTGVSSTPMTGMLPGGLSGISATAMNPMGSSTLAPQASSMNIAHSVSGVSHSMTGTLNSTPTTAIYTLTNFPVISEILEESWVHRSDRLRICTENIVASRQAKLEDFRGLLDIVLQDKLGFETASKIGDWILSKGLTPNSHFFSIFCLIFSRDPSLEGYDKVSQMFQCVCPLNAHTFASLIRCHGALHDVLSAVRVLKHFREILRSMSANDLKYRFTVYQAAHDVCLKSEWSHQVQKWIYLDEVQGVDGGRKPPPPEGLAKIYMNDERPAVSASEAVSHSNTSARGNYAQQMSTITNTNFNVAGINSNTNGNTPKTVTISGTGVNGGSNLNCSNNPPGSNPSVGANGSGVSNLNLGATNLNIGSGGTMGTNANGMNVGSNTANNTSIAGGMGPVIGEMGANNNTVLNTNNGMTGSTNNNTSNSSNGNNNANNHVFGGGNINTGLGGGGNSNQKFQKRGRNHGNSKKNNNQFDGTHYRTAFPPPVLPPSSFNSTMSNSNSFNSGNSLKTSNSNSFNTSNSVNNSDYSTTNGYTNGYTSGSGSNTFNNGSSSNLPGGYGNYTDNNSNGHGNFNGYGINQQLNNYNSSSYDNNMWDSWNQKVNNNATGTSGIALGNNKNNNTSGTSENNTTNGSTLGNCSTLHSNGSTGNNIGSSNQFKENGSTADGNGKRGTFGQVTTKGQVRNGSQDKNDQFSNLLGNTTSMDSNHTMNKSHSANPTLLQYNDMQYTYENIDRYANMNAFSSISISSTDDDEVGNSGEGANDIRNRIDYGKTDEYKTDCIITSKLIAPARLVSNAHGSATTVNQGNSSEGESNRGDTREHDNAVLEKLFNNYSNNEPGISSSDDNLAAVGAAAGSDTQRVPMPTHRPPPSPHKEWF